MIEVGTGMARFGFLWAFALLYHQVFYRAVLASPLDAALALAAVAALLWPGSVAILGMLAGLHFLVTAQHLPAVHNHWYFSSLVSLALLLAAIGAGPQSRRSRMPVPDACMASFAPAGLACLLLLYFLSGFHKLNHDFLSPGVSCGSVMFGRLLMGLGLPDRWHWLGPAAIGLTLAAELGLPMLLAIPRTRRAGLIVALLFHGVMGLAGYPRFSAIAVALLALLLPAESAAWWPPQRLRLFLAAVLLLGAAAGPPVANPLFLAAQLLLTGFVLVLALRTEPREAAAPMGYRSPAGTLGWAPMLAPALVLLSGATPYLGLGTDRALAMYSNLRTEGGRTNHLLIPTGAQLFPYQRDLVVILASSLPRLQRMAERRMAVPYQELRAILTEETAGPRPSASVLYVRHGERRESGDAGRDPALGLPVSRMARSLLRFRPVEASGRRACAM